MTATTLLPVDPAAVATARRDVARAAAGAGLDPDRVADLVVAVSEACTNALEAQQRSGAPDAIELSCGVREDRFEVVVRDHGAGFDPATTPKRPPVTDPNHLDVARGWGIQLMHALVDEVAYTSTDDGTALVLRCRLVAR